MIALGCDVGSLFTKLVVIDDDRPDDVMASRVLRTTGTIGTDLEAEIDLLLHEARVPRARLGSIGATGRFASLVPGATFVEDEAHCVAAAVACYLPGVEVALHLGGQSSLAISLDAAGEPVRLVRNDKCASGTGRFLEAMGRKLDVGLDDIDGLVAGAAKPTTITNQCVVYAESEVISYINDGATRADVFAGICSSLGRMAVAQARRLCPGAMRPYTLTGGLARLASVVAVVEAGLGIQRRPFPHDPKLAAALGAALLEDDPGHP
jgi:predicted CoA-substrate-specific enzyme activase